MFRHALNGEGDEATGSLCIETAESFYVPEPEIKPAKQRRFKVSRFLRELECRISELGTA